MGLFKRIKELENQNLSLATSLAECKKELAELKERLPEYEAAVAKGVGDTWEKACNAVIDFDPYHIKEKLGGDL